MGRMARGKHVTLTGESVATGILYTLRWGGGFKPPSKYKTVTVVLHILRDTAPMS